MRAPKIWILRQLFSALISFSNQSFYAVPHLLKFLVKVLSLFVKVSLDGSPAAGSLHHDKQTCCVGDTEDSDRDGPSSDSRWLDAFCSLAARCRCSPPTLMQQRVHMRRRPSNTQASRRRTRVRCISALKVSAQISRAAAGTNVLKRMLIRNPSTLNMPKAHGGMGESVGG